MSASARGRRFLAQPRSPLYTNVLTLRAATDEFALPRARDRHAGHLGALLGDHEFLIGLHDKDGDGRRRTADCLPTGGIGGFIEVDADPSHVAKHRRTNRRRVLANTGGEDERIEAADRCS